ncbi:hypothetical protein [Sphingosinicella sp. CPCC 101087]|uniref:YkvI family membrane protein n=1 Tax=Sphingosinicella sp. CPCC 101087 TaxID=2497754 RepID=UPI00101DFAAA|nr:hypothetical protein [Sphingosinicella sp. CPCC 101087]
MASGTSARSTWFQRFLLPALAFKAVVIGGGYATGREIAEFFLTVGPIGGLYGILLAMALWSAVCALTFLFARAFAATDYRAFFRALLGPFWFLFEIVYVLLMVLILAVMAAAAGSIGAAFGLPHWAGTAALMAAIVGVTGFGTAAAERMFRFSSAFIYLVYGGFLVLALASFGGRIAPQFAAAEAGPAAAWIAGGATYAGYNLVAAVAILPFLRHLTSRRDAVAAGLLCGPVAMLPALLFFLCMVAFYPEVGGEALPSDFLLRRLEAPWFHLLFQAMILCALLETGVGMVNAINERVAASLERRRQRFGRAQRLALSAALVIGSGVVAARFGLIDLIARGYGAFGWIMLALFVLPLATIGVARLMARKGGEPERGEAHAA